MSEEKITLSLEPDVVFPMLDLGSAQDVETIETDPEKVAEIAKVAENSLSPEELTAVEEFSKKIDIADRNAILQYGAGSQKKIAEFSESALSNVKTKDIGEVGDMITGLISELKSFDTEDEKRGFLGLFKKASNKISTLKTKYDKAEVSVDRIIGSLENHQVQLLKDISLLDKMYNLNLTYFKELSMYILAGKKKIEQVRTVDLPALTAKAHATNLPEDAQAARDLDSHLNGFEKKIYDLELTRMISIQMAPQIRLVQNNDTIMVEKIQTTIVNTIPLWKSQMVIALGLAHSQQAIQAQREVTNMTNELLRKNADSLKLGTVEAAKESERGIADIETLKYTNESLISTLDEVMRIQDEGRVKRQEAESELVRIEGELKHKLLEIRDAKSPS